MKTLGYVSDDGSRLTGLRPPECVWIQEVSPSWSHAIVYYYYTIPYYIIPYHTIPYHTILYYTTLHYTTLHYTTLHYTTLHYTCYLAGAGSGSCSSLPRRRLRNEHSSYIQKENESRNMFAYVDKMMI